MESFKDCVNYMKGYQHVADFQKFCGVDIVEVESLLHKNGDIPNGTKSGTDTKSCCQSHESGELSKNGRTNGHNGVKHTNGHSNETVATLRKNTSFKNGISNPDSNETKLAYKINNKLLYFVFQFGAGLGSEFFYITFFPFMLWNVNCQLTRTMLFIWYPLMYIGQFLKDRIRWPRPGPPAVRLEGNRFEMEYGMPSTHTIVGTCIPFSLLVLISRYYEVYNAF